MLVQLEELWSVFNFLLPDFLGAHRPFMKEVVRPVQQSMLERRKLLSLEASQARNAQREEGKHPSNERERKLSIAAEGIDILRKLHKQVSSALLTYSKPNTYISLMFSSFAGVAFYTASDEGGCCGGYSFENCSGCAMPTQ